jgi:hypothetical protein
MLSLAHPSWAIISNEYSGQKQPYKSERISTAMGGLSPIEPRKKNADTEPASFEFRVCDQQPLKRRAIHLLTRTILIHPAAGPQSNLIGNKIWIFSPIEEQMIGAVECDKGFDSAGGLKDLFGVIKAQGFVQR